MQINNFQTTSTNAWGNIRYDNLKNMTDLSAQIAQNRYAADQCCCETNRNIDALKYALSKENSEGIQKIADILNERKNLQTIIIVTHDNSIEQMLDLPKILTI